MFPTVTGKPPPSSPPCAMTASRRLRSSTVPSTARPSWPGCSSAWCRCCGRATLSCWTISPPTKSPVCLTPLKRPAPSCAICRLTVPASIPSNSSSPNSRRCCVKPPPAPSMPCGTPSATCWPPFLPPSAQTTSLMPDTAYLLGKCYSLKLDCSGDMRLLAPHLIRRPRLRQVQPGGHRPGQRALGVMTIDRDLAVGHFARRPAILAGHADRVPPLLLKAGVIKDEHPIAFAGQGLQAGDALAVEGVFIPDHVGQQMIELLLVGFGHDLSQGLAVLVGMLTEQAGEILPQGLRTRPLGKMHAQRGQKLGQFWQRCSRCLRQSRWFLDTGAHSHRLSQIYGL